MSVRPSKNRSPFAVISSTCFSRTLLLATGGVVKLLPSLVEDAEGWALVVVLVDVPEDAEFAGGFTVDL